MRRFVYTALIVALFITSAAMVKPAKASHLWDLTNLVREGGKITLTATNLSNDDDDVGLFLTIYVNGAYSLYWEPVSDGGTLPGGSYTWELSDPALVGDIYIYSGDDEIGCPTPTFCGPALPGAGARDLVLMMTDTAVFSAPNGSPTGRVLRACQTAFVLDVQNDFAKIFFMGGWVPTNTYVDVAEDYGQPGGQAIYAPCVGK
jgi:hypothetical protein